jgi:3-methyl-2-oxobutanoate hydroxymethyltransferase
MSSNRDVKPQTAQSIRDLKGKRPIVCLTAYDEPFARFADESGVDLILVGDSVGMVALGMADTLGVSLEAMIHHTRAAKFGVKEALLATDMPFGSYGSSVEQAVNSGVALMKAGASAVKLEGNYPEEVAALVKVGIPVIGHLGMTPQSLNIFGGFKVQGRDGTSRKILLDSAKRLESAGAFAIVLELVPIDLAKEVTEALSIPTIGIGAGPYCDGQIQVIYDILGVTGSNLKHSRRYAELETICKGAISNYVQDVKSQLFPNEENGFK